jgi:hypothetical protein
VSLASLVLLWSPSAPGSGISVADFSGGAEVLAAATVRTSGLAVPEARSAQALSAESSGADCAAAVPTDSLTSGGAGCGAAVTTDGVGGWAAGAVAGAGTGG